MKWFDSLFVIYSFCTVTAALTKITYHSPMHNKAVICTELSYSYLESFEKNDGFRYCTHLILGGIVDRTIKTPPWELKPDRERMEGIEPVEYILDSRKRHPHLSVILGIHLTDELLQMATNQTARREFIGHAISFILRYNLNGLDLYWKSESIGKAEKEAPVILVKDLRHIFDYHNLLLTSTFGKYDDDNQFDQSEPLLLEMSKHLDFMHISKKSTINGLIKIGVPSKKITIQQELDIRSTISSKNYDRVGFYHLCSGSFTYKPEKFEILCDVEKCRATPDYHFKKLFFESTRHIANKMRFAMRHNLAGALVFSPGNDYWGECPIEQDTFLDFRTMEGIQLNIPTRNRKFQRIQVVHHAITVSLDEIRQEIELSKQNNIKIK